MEAFGEHCKNELLGVFSLCIINSVWTKNLGWPGLDASRADFGQLDSYKPKDARQ